MALTDSTLLSLSGISLSDYSVRGATMTLEPIAGTGDLVRSIDGTLLDWTSPQFQKYAATITCTDVDSPDLEGIWRGLPVTVTCIAGLGGTSTAGQTVLNMMVESWHISRDEWGCQTSWELNLLEV